MRANFIHLEHFLRQVITEGIPGDVAEIGVWYATTFMPMAELCRMSGKTIHAVDSFEGMPKPTKEDGKEFPKGDLNVGGSYFFKVLMGGYKDTIKLHEGWVPDILQELRHIKFSFVHLDIDHYHTTKEALNFIWPRMSPGGVLACHDFFPDRDTLCARAIKEWMADKEPYAYNQQSTHVFFVK